MKKKLKTRNPAADVIRCFACYLVISVHFFLNGGSILLMSMARECIR
mgnify:CR=1 FL=1